MKVESKVEVWKETLVFFIFSTLQLFHRSVDKLYTRNPRRLKNSWSSFMTYYFDLDFAILSQWGESDNVSPLFLDLKKSSLTHQTHIELGIGSYTITISIWFKKLRSGIVQLGIAILPITARFNLPNLVWSKSNPTHARVRMGSCLHSLRLDPSCPFL